MHDAYSPLALLIGGESPLQTLSLFDLPLSLVNEKYQVSFLSYTEGKRHKTQTIEKRCEINKHLKETWVLGWGETEGKNEKKLTLQRGQKPPFPRELS